MKHSWNFPIFPKITIFSKIHNSAADFLTMFLYGSKVADFCPLKHIKKSRKSKNTYFGKLSFSEKKVDKKICNFFSVYLFFSQLSSTIPTTLPKTPNWSENSLKSYSCLNIYIPFLYGQLPKLYGDLYGWTNDTKWILWW